MLIPYVIKPKHISQNLVKATDYFIQRKLDKAIKATEYVLKDDNIDDVTQHGSIYIKSYSLLTKGRYLYDRSLLEMAFELAKILEDSPYIKPISVKVLLGDIYFYQKNYIQSLPYYKSAFNLAVQHDDSEDKLITTIALSTYYSSTNNFKKAKEYIDSAALHITSNTVTNYCTLYYSQRLSIYINTHQFLKIGNIAPSVIEKSKRINDVESEVKALNAYAISLAIKGNYKQAFEYFIKTKELAEQIDFGLYAGKALINLSNVLASLYNTEQTIKYLNIVLNKYSHTLDPITLGITHHNLGGAYYLDGILDKALESFMTSFNIGEENGIPQLKNRALFEIIQIYILQKDWNSVLKFADITEKLYQERDKTLGEEINLVNLAYMAYYKKEYDKAIEYAKKGVELCLKIKGKKTLARAYHLLSDIYEAIENYKQSNFYLRAAIKENKAMNQEMRRRQMIDLEIHYESKEKEKEIELLKNKMELQNLQLLHQQKVQEQNVKLQNANEDLKQFTYAVSHDLKEPIRMIGSFSKLLYRKFKKDLNEDTEEYFHYVLDGANRMSLMLNGLLNYATIGTKEQNFELVDLNKIMGDVLANLYFMIKENEAEVTFSNLPIISTNAVFISQLLQNLISNALKFRKKDVNPIVNIDIEIKANQYIISIADNGIGIKDEYKEDIFKIFKRLHTRNEYQGTGIGLSVCKKIVNFLRGDIWLTSEHDVGTTFYVSIPK